MRCPARTWIILPLLLALASRTADSFAAENGEKIRVLIVDGQNNHDWKTTTPYLKSVLEESGRFQIEIATTPPSPATDEGRERYGGSAERYQAEMSQFRPEFERFDAILLNYNGDPWPEATHAALEAAIAGGKGLIVVHAADNAFPGRATYDRMLGLAWRPAEFGVRLEIDADGRITRIEPGPGIGSGHGKRRPFRITVRTADHPVTLGMPLQWMHARDELYNRLRGPAEEMTVLATAFDDPADDGSGFHEPIAWTVRFGKGRVFHTTLGHDRDAMRCVGFITLLLRGVEWSATERVTFPIPDDFPTADKVSTRDGLLRSAAKRYWLIALGLLLCLVLLRQIRRRRIRRRTFPATVPDSMKS